MSKIDNYNMELEEEFRDQLNELGFETLQDALNAGWEVYDGELVRQKDLSDKAYEQAQKDWGKEKEGVLEAIRRIKAGIENSYEEGFNPMFAAITLDGNTDNAIRYSDLVKVEDFIKKARF